MNSNHPQPPPLEDIPVILSSDENKTSTGKVRVQNFSQKQRALRALKIFGLCWGAGLAAVFLPLVHFVLVPALILAGLVVPGFIYFKESLILGGEGTCPKCQAPLKIEKSANEWPLSDQCTQCRSAIRIVKAGK